MTYLSTHYPPLYGPPKDFPPPLPSPLRVALTFFYVIYRDTCN
jgi:hypothetical protein